MRVHAASLREFVPATWTIPENPFLGPGMAGLAEFVPGSFTLPPQPAGIGAFVDASFTLPPQPAGVGDLVSTMPMYPIPQNSVLQNAASIAYQNGLKVGDVHYGLGQAPPPTLAQRFQTWQTGPHPYLQDLVNTQQQLLASGHPIAAYQAARHPWGTWALQAWQRGNQSLQQTPSGVSGIGDCGCGCGGHCGGGMSGLGQAATDLSASFSSIASGNWSGAWSSFVSFLGDPVFGTSVPIWMVGGGLVLAWALFFSGGEHSRYQRGRSGIKAYRKAYA